MSTKRFNAMATRAKKAKPLISNLRLKGCKSATVWAWNDGDKVIQMQNVKGKK